MWAFLSNTFFVVYKLILIATGYKQTLDKFEYYHFTKCLINLGRGVCVCVGVCVFYKKGDQLELF